MAGSEYVLAKGTQIEISTTEVTDISTGESGATFQDLDAIKKTISWSGTTSDEIDVTTFASGDFKEFAVGMKDPGSLTISGHYVLGSDAYQAIIQADKDGKRRLIRITFADGGKFKAIGSVRERSFEDSVEGVVTGSVTIRLSGEPVEEKS